MRKNKGFTLIELMIALVIGGVLILGVTSTYSSIQTSIQTSKDLENAQEVVRYTSQVFTRSLKQTWDNIDIVGDTVVVKQKENVRPCVGDTPVLDYTETFAFDGSNLKCSVVTIDGNVVENETIILTGIADMRFVVDGTGTLFTVTVLPTELPENFNDGVNPAGVNIAIALNTLILRNAMPGA